MAWDFTTEPEFEEKLAWMREFVREEIYPLEVLGLDHREFRALAKPLQERVKEQGLWAAHLDPELGGQGYGQVKLGLMHEILGGSDLAPSDLRLPGARLRQRRADRPGGDRRAAGEVAQAAARRRALSAYSMTEQGTGLRPQAVHDARGA